MSESDMRYNFTNGGFSFASNDSWFLDLLWLPSSLVNESKQNIHYL